MSPTNHVKQHFIPVCYLKGFSNNNKSLYVYDKQLSKSYGKAFEKVGYEDNFYKIDRKFIDMNKSEVLDENFYETEYFAKNIESEYNKLLVGLRERASLWLENKVPCAAFSNNLELHHFAAYLGIQYLRLPGIRKMHYDAHKKGQEKRLEIIKALLISKHSEFEGIGDNIVLKHDEGFGAVIHSWLYSDPKMVNLIQDRLLNKSWAFLVSPDNQLYTSDNPIVIINRLKIPAIVGDLTLRGAQIIFPIARNILLSMWDHDYFDHQKYLLNGFNSISPQDMRTNNLYQYANAIQQVYCASNGFEIIKTSLAGNNGEHFYLPQPKIDVY